MPLTVAEASPELVRVAPQDGKQWSAFASSADVVFYGGSAGGGKSWWLTYEPMRHVRVKGFNAIVFRRTGPELIGGGSIWEESKKIYPHFGGRPRQSPVLDWTFNTDDDGVSLIEFRHLQYQSDLDTHQSKQYCLIEFDELTHFTEEMFWYFFSRNRSTCGVRPYIRAAMNPDVDSWVAGFISWWIDQDTGYAIEERGGVIRHFFRDPDTEQIEWGDSEEELVEKFPSYFFNEDGRRNNLHTTTFTFIPAKLEDNPKMMDADPAYESRMALLPKVERERLRWGNWKIKLSAGLYFPRHKVKYVEVAPAEVVARVRGWDKAATKPSPSNKDPDWTIGVRMSRGYDGLIYIEHVHRMRDDPLEVESDIIGFANTDTRDTSVAMWQDPGQAGKSERKHFERLLFGRVIEFFLANKDKTTFAKPFSSQWLAGNVRIVGDPDVDEWIEPFLKAMEAFAGTATVGHDDDVDTCSVCFLKLGSGMTAEEFLKAMTKRLQK